MTTVVADISVSLDGFVTGPDAGPDNGLGTGGEPLHTWVLESDDPLDAEILATLDRALRRRGDGPQPVRRDRRAERLERRHGLRRAARRPAAVLRRHPRAADHVRLGLDFRFVPDVATAIEQAKAVAGDKDVFVMGGGEIIRQSVDAGLVDELVLHLSPVVLGAGTPLFVDAARRELVQREVRPSRTAVHLTYDVR